MQVMSGNTVCWRSRCRGWGRGIPKRQRRNLSQRCVFRRAPIVFTYVFTVPLPVVFTKLNLLANGLKAEAMENGEILDDAAFNQRKLESLERLCLAPIRGPEHIACGCFRYVKAIFLPIFDTIMVTVMEGCDDALVALVDETTKYIKNYLKDEAALHIASIAQRVSISLKIASTIAYASPAFSL